MIRSRREYKITLNSLSKFQKGLGEMIRSDKLSSMAEAEVAAMESVIAELSQQLQAYRLQRRQDRE